MNEYRLVRLRPLEPHQDAEQYDYRYIEEELKRYSLNRWEVVSIAPGGGEWVALLKRPVELVTLEQRLQNWFEQLAGMLPPAEWGERLRRIEEQLGIARDDAKG